MIKAEGGAAVVQEPGDAIYPGMPASALKHVSVDAVVPSAAIGETIAAMVNGKALPSGIDPEASSPTPPSAEAGILICPECGGVLSERREAGVDHWECRVGHRYSPDTLADAQAADVEAALWTAVRALSDRSRLLHRMADQAASRRQERSAGTFRRRGRPTRRAS
jgi:two-component system chemotaxis response regulator CheB